VGILAGANITFAVSGAWTVWTVLQYIDNTYAASEAAVRTPRLIVTASLGPIVLSGGVLMVLYRTTRWRYDKHLDRPNGSKHVAAQ
jgi:hypothetical protein